MNALEAGYSKRRRAVRAGYGTRWISKKKLTRPGVSNSAAAVVRGVQNRKMNGDYAWPFHTTR